MKVVLSVNAGSSSVKVSVFTARQKQDPRQIAEAQVSGLTSPPALLTYQRHGKSVVEDKDVGDSVDGQDDAFKTLLDTITDDSELSEVAKKEDIGIVAHRVVHGGEYKKCQVIGKKTLHHIQDLGDLAPLHNGAALNIIRTCIDQLPDSTNVACFDTQFHQSIPQHIYTYPIDPEMAKANKLRKYGFHGISYSFITRTVAESLGKKTDDVNLIVLHLGSGASACAIRGGKSMDTSMGLTPVSGLPGATRSGSVDPRYVAYSTPKHPKQQLTLTSLVFHCISDVGKLSQASTPGLNISKAEQVLNKQCGWKALTGTTDFNDILSSDDPSHRLALDIFVDRILGFVGAYFVTLGGRVDALVFAGGIGEHGAELRRRVAEGVECLGFGIDDRLNEGGLGEGLVTDLSRQGVERKILACVTDEQFEMARMCANSDELW